MSKALTLPQKKVLEGKLIPKDWRKSKEYRLWKITIIKRDKRCQCCGSFQNRHAHHIKSAKYHKSIRFDPNNGICLCYDCHMTIHNKFAGGYRKKCTDVHLDRMLFVKNLMVDKVQEAIGDKSKGDIMLYNQRVLSVGT